MNLRLCYLLLFLLTSACVKKEAPRTFTPVTFVLPATLTPERATFAVGDTLWLTLNCSDSLLDLRSGRRFRVQPQDIPILSAVGFYELLGKDKEKASATAAFQVISQVGQLLITGSRFGRLEPVYDGSFYRARVGVIPQRRGVFALTVFTDMGDFLSAAGTCHSLI